MNIITTNISYFILMSIVKIFRYNKFSSESDAVQLFLLEIL